MQHNPCHLTLSRESHNGGTKLRSQPFTGTNSNSVPWQVGVHPSQGSHSTLVTLLTCHAAWRCFVWAPHGRKLIILDKPIIDWSLIWSIVNIRHQYRRGYWYISSNELITAGPASIRDSIFKPAKVWLAQKVSIIIVWVILMISIQLWAWWPDIFSDFTLLWPCQCPMVFYLSTAPLSKCLIHKAVKFQIRILCFRFKLNLKSAGYLVLIFRI